MQSSEYTSNPSSRVGPRAKCDQVVYEAIAKATEILVRGRCQVPPSAKSRNGGGSGNGGTGAGGGAGGGGTGAGARFNLEVEEVDSVRAILLMWKKNLHVPLRLDVYYEYCTDPMQIGQSTRKELLERWCIDYLDTHTPNTHPSHSTMSSHMSAATTTHAHHPAHSMYFSSNRGHGNAAAIVDDTIAQLRQVCKRVVILLRSLYCFTRMMPAYRLHHALVQDDLNFAQNVEAGGGVGGYFHNSNRPGGGGPGLGGGYYTGVGDGVSDVGGVGGGARGSLPEWQAQEREQIGGKIKYSFYVSDTSAGRPGLAPDAALFSSSSNKPFARHDLNPTPTPYGLLHFSALYDESLHVNKVLQDRTNRLIHWSQTRAQTMESNPNPFASRAIPINIPPPLTDTQGNDITDDSSRHSYRQAQTLQPRLEQDRIDSNNSGSSNSNRAIIQQMSLPNPSPSNLHGASLPSHPSSIRSSTPSDHLMPQQLIPNHIGTPPLNEGGLGLRKRLGSDPLKPSGPSGIALALMNSNEGMQGGNGGSQHSPPRSIDGVTSLKEQQRMALHHPPPTPDYGVTPAYSSSPKPRKNSISQISSNSYGYGYGKPVIPNLSSSPMTVHSYQTTGDADLTNSPIPLVNTPPQPLFLGRRFSGTPVLEGSLPSRLSPRKSSLDQPSLSSPPFQNPLMLNAAPSLTSRQSDDGSHSGGDGMHQTGQSIPSQTTALGIDKDLVLPPLNSFDGLNKSPFLPMPQSSRSSTTSPFASLSVGMGSMAYGRQDEGFPSTVEAAFSSSGSALGGTNSRFGSDYTVRNQLSADYARFDGQSYDDEDDMPFAVDDTDPIASSRKSLDVAGLAPPGSSTQLQMGTSSAAASSMAVSSLARKCATAAPLNLFSDTTDSNSGGDGVGDNLISLSKQLDEFKSFGASLSGGSLLSQQPTSTTSTVET